MSQDQKPDIRYVIIHTPGRIWKPGVDFREQPHVMEHVTHFLGVKERGELALGGPFLNGTGGMMITAAGVTADRAEAIASTDPTVKLGLVNYEVRPWYVAMKA